TPASTPYCCEPSPSIRRCTRSCTRPGTGPRGCPSRWTPSPMPDRAGPPRPGPTKAGLGRPPGCGKDDRGLPCRHLLEEGRLKRASSFLCVMSQPGENIDYISYDSRLDRLDSLLGPYHEQLFIGSSSTL